MLRPDLLVLGVAWPQAPPTCPTRPTCLTRLGVPCHSSSILFTYNGDMPRNETKKIKQLTRREALGAFGAAAAMALTAAACGDSTTTPTGSSSTTTSTTTGGTTNASCAITPLETEGPYPDRLGLIGNQSFFRRDVTEGKPGLPLTLALTVVASNKSCAPVQNAVVEIWHCDAAGTTRSIRSRGSMGADRRSCAVFRRPTRTATFTSIYPGWYGGRATHIHVEVFVNGASVKTTQVAFSESVTSAVYATGVYASKGRNPTSNSGDMVFSDGTSLELATLTGSTASGYTAALTVSLNA